MKKTCPTFNDEKSLLLNQTVNALRDSIENLVHLDAPLEVLEDLKQQAVKIADITQTHQGEKHLPQFHLEFDHNELNSFLPYSPVSGYFNPLAAPLELVKEGDKVIGKVNFGSAYEGPPKSVHGGIIAAVFDQLLAMVTTINNVAGPTAYLNTHYHLPTPIEQDLRYEAWIERIEGKKVFVKGQCLVDEQVVTTADGLFIKFG